MPGTVVRVKGIKRYFEPKTGKVYCYHRASGKRIKEEFGTPIFFERLAELERETRVQREQVSKPETLKALILDYKQSDSFKDLAKRTKSDYEKVFTFLEPLYEAGITDFTTDQIIKLRNRWRKERGRCFLNRTRIVLSVLFGHAIELGLMRSNPVANTKQIRRPRIAQTVNRPWTIVERQVVLNSLPSHLKLPVTIALCSGMRMADVLQLPVSVINSEYIRLKTAKRGVWVQLPIIPELRQAILEAEWLKQEKIGSEYLCLNSKGVAWTNSGFSCSFRKALKNLENEGKVDKGLTFHGLRHTVATVLAERGVSLEDIASVLGQSSSQMAAHYARQADRTARTQAAMAKYAPF